MSTTHSQTISGLAPSTLYFYSVQSVDSSGNPVTANGFTFGTTNTTDNTPPTVSMTAPANNATVSGTVTVSANASDNVAWRACNSCSTGRILGSADYGVAIQHVVEHFDGKQRVAHDAATAKDTSGNTTTSAAVTVTVSNSTSNAAADFQTRCGGSGVIRCVGFDSIADIQRKCSAGYAEDHAGSLHRHRYDAVCFGRRLAALHRAGVGSGSANTSGSYDIDFSDDFSAQIDSLVNGDPASQDHRLRRQPVQQ